MPGAKELSLAAMSLVIASLIVDAIRKVLPRDVVDERASKAIFITGCDTGFGNSLARRLDTLGFPVFAGCLLPEGPGAQQLRQETSNLLQIVKCDVTSQEEVDEAVVKVGALLKDAHLHAIVNNAGVFTFSEVEWCPLEMYRKLFEINCLGAIRVTKAFLPLVRAHGDGGRVVIVASLAGRYTLPGLSAYSASKHATISFSDALRREMHKFNISVHTVEPSTYRTPILTESSLEGTMKRVWDEANDEVRQSYGEEYRNAFKRKYLAELKNARPESQIYEVVDDILDATVGQHPNLRYVPSAAVTLRSQIIQSLPTSLMDTVLERRVLPPTPPACVMKHRERRLKNPYTDGAAKSKPELKRFMSTPVFDKVPMTGNTPEGKTAKFNFPPPSTLTEEEKEE